MRNRILLHHCCAVCTPAVLEFFRKNFSEVAGFWFNPNIYPAEENTRRLSSLREFDKGYAILVKDGYAARTSGRKEAYSPDGSQGQELNDAWLSEIGGSVREPERCGKCYAMRLRETALAAKDGGFGHFSTTLLSSPYQKHDLVRQAGEEASGVSGVEFIDRDFRQEFYRGRDVVRQKGLYMQKYCGCVFSYREFEQRVAVRNKREVVAGGQAL
ncbi:MAG: epoxyqueuosine reductase QueH [Elusimicrobia bacterium]|nr:epoxyqueuosine reductase QueH [Elusimicrobiota bacterium]